MAIERTTGGVIEANFRYIDEVIDDEDMSLADKVKHMATLTNNITKIGGLELASRKFAVQAPDMARKAGSINLVHNGKAKSLPSE